MVNPQSQESWTLTPKDDSTQAGASPAGATSYHNQMMGPQGHVLVQQNLMIDQMLTNSMQGNKQQFNTQNQSSDNVGPAQMMRGQVQKHKETWSSLRDTSRQMLPSKEL